MPDKKKTTEKKPTTAKQFALGGKSKSMGI